MTALGQPGGDATMVGYIRTPDAAGPFSPADDLAARRFYTLDPAKIGAALGLPQVAPFTLVALGAGGAAGACQRLAAAAERPSELRPDLVRPGRCRC